MEEMTKIASQLSVADLKAQIAIYFDNFEEGADLVFNALLNALRIKISEAEYVAFCDSI